MFGNTTGGYNTAMGAFALQANTTASNNTAVGYQAGYSNTTGVGNTCVGTVTGYSLTTGSSNVFIGFQSGNYGAGYFTTTGSSNSGVGGAALAFNTTGSNNTANGFQALFSNTTASQSTAVGYQAGYTQSGASTGNTSFGYQSGFAITQGTYNTSIGHTAGSNVSTGTFNTFLGTSAGTDAVFNCTTQSNRVVVGDNAVTNAYIKVAWTVTSDARDKTSFAPVPHGLAFVNSLTPTAYQFRVSRENETATGPVRYGFKAQDILAVEGDSPVIIDNSDSENLKYNQDSMIAILVNAIKELKAEVDSLKSQLNGASA